jgi:hypothetical protein
VGLRGKPERWLLSLGPISTKKGKNGKMEKSEKAEKLEKREKVSPYPACGKLD